MVAHLSLMKNVESKKKEVNAENNKHEKVGSRSHDTTSHCKLVYQK